MDDITFVRSHWWVVSEVFHHRPPTPMYRNSPPLCTIVLQIPSLMPLKMRKVQVAALGTVVSVGVACGVSVGSAAGVTGLGNDVEPSAVAGTVAPPGVGVVSPQASRAARITRAIHRGKFSIRETISIAISEFRVPYG